MDREEIIRLLGNGYHIAYVPLAGDVALLNETCRDVKDINIGEFLRLQESEVIKYASTTRAHPYFHGRVDIYALNKELNDISSAVEILSK